MGEQKTHPPQAVGGTENRHSTIIGGSVIFAGCRLPVSAVIVMTAAIVTILVGAAAEVRVGVGLKMQKSEGGQYTLAASTVTETSSGRYTATSRDHGLDEMIGISDWIAWSSPMRSYSLTGAYA